MGLKVVIAAGVNVHNVRPRVESRRANECSVVDAPGDEGSRCSTVQHVLAVADRTKPVALAVSDAAARVVDRQGQIKANVK